MIPRAVLVERPTEYRELLARHGTREQARFFLDARGRTLAEVEERHRALEAARATVLAAIPADWRRAAVPRPDLDRFLFAPDDVVVVLGQDGLVANVAKYLDGQPVIGLNPEPGVLVPTSRQRPPTCWPTSPPAARAPAAHDGGGAARRRPGAARAQRDLRRAREPPVGPLRAALGERAERQSSSGLIVATGTGATGWAASIHRERHSGLALPAPEDDRLAFFVREPWPSAWTGASLDEGVLGAGALLSVQSEMNDGGVVFGDGIEGDRLELDWGRRVEVGVAAAKLRLVG